MRAVPVLSRPVLTAVLALVLVAGGCSSDGSPSLDPQDSTESQDVYVPIGQPCTANNDCGDGYCDPIDKACVECTVDAHCPEGLRCASGACLEGIQCQPGSASCDGEGNAVVCNAVGTGYQTTEACTDDIECTTDSCIEGSGCVFKANDEACDDDNECTLDTCDPSKGCAYEVADECKTGGLADVTPSKLSFADTIPEDQVSKEVVSIGNAGLGELKVIRLVIAAESNVFSFTVDGEEGLTDHQLDPPILVPAGEEYDLSLFFAPLELGEYEGTLTIWTNDPTKPEGKVTVPMSGSGVADNCIGVSPESVEFGPVNVGVTQEKDLLLENCGEGLVPVYTVSLLGNTSGAFSLVASLTPPFDLDVGQSTVITLGFAPPKPDTAYEAKLVIENGAPKTPLLEIPLSGSGKP